MKRKTKIIVFAVIYTLLCLLSSFPATIFFNHDLTFDRSLDKDRARQWGLSVYEDVTIEPNVLNLPNGKMRLGNAFLVIGRYRKYTIPYVPGVMTGNKYSFKIDTDWQRIQLRFDVIESPTGDIFGPRTGPAYQIKILEEPLEYYSSSLIYNDTACSINVTKDRYKQYHGYILYANKKVDYASNKDKVDGTDFVITVSWDKALKDWGSEEKVWYSGYSDPCEVNK
jgi:hypothetical protein